MTVLTARPRAAFVDVPRTPAGHLGLYLYAAAARIAGLLRRLGIDGGGTPNTLLDRHPFLASYETELRRRLGEIGFAEAAIEVWEAGCDRPLPLHALGGELGLDLRRRLAFAVIGLPEEDSRFGALFAELQGGPRRPSIEVLGRLFPEAQEDGWAFCRPLLACGLAVIEDADAPRAEQQLRVTPIVWDAARGELGQRLPPGASFRPIAECPRIDELLHPTELLRRLEKLPYALAQGRTRIVLLRTPSGVDIEEISAAIARQLDRSLLRLDRAAADSPSVGPLLSLARAVPLIEYDLGPGETIDPPRLAGYAGPVLMALGVAGGLNPQRSAATVTLEVPFPGAELRELHWRRAFGDARVEDLEVVRDRFQIGGAYIRTVAHTAAAQAALEGREAVGARDVRDASRLLNRQLLDSLAQFLEARGRWSDLVSSALTRDRLGELEQRCVHRERIGDRVGHSFRASVGRGVRALFAGSSGTGKTMAARILAAELGMDVYRVDLAAVVNKYVGETEKNLHLVLTRAEALDVVLLLDEGDALLGRRSEVKSANDRYANLETNYLLQRLETYQGVAIVTTNFAENIDPAFQRRMDVVVPFFPPGPDERRLIWELHLPADHRIEAEILERVAQRCALTGGQIRNAVLQAAALALEAGAPMQQPHLQSALLREYQKAGVSFPLFGEQRRRRRPHGGLPELVAALRAR